MPSRKFWLWAGQGVLAALLGLFVVRAVIRNWSAFPRDVHIDLQGVWIVAAAVTILVTYGLLIAAWRQILAGWGHHLRYRTAARIWCVSNLGRYLPGKVWSIAGLTVLARNAGVEGTAAAAAALAMQAIAIGTGAAVVAVGSPGAVSPLGLTIAMLLTVAVVWGLVSTRAIELVARLMQSVLTLNPLPVSSALGAAAATMVSWLTYGVAFWLLGIGLLPQGMPALLTTIGIFASGYIVGLLALFAPGGVGVRELVHVALLAPFIGNGGALAVSIAARLLLTITETGAAAMTLTVARYESPS